MQEEASEYAEVGQGKVRGGEGEQVMVRDVVGSQGRRGEAEEQAKDGAEEVEAKDDVEEVEARDDAVQPAAKGAAEVVEVKVHDGPQFLFAQEA